MDKVQAEQYIHNSMITMATRKLLSGLALICCIIAIVCFIMYQGVAYIVVAAALLCGAVVISIIANVRKFRKEYYKAIFGASIVLILCCLFNLWMYGIFQYISNFVWWAYAILIACEIMAFFGSLLINMMIVNKVSKKKSRAVNMSIVCSAAILGSSLGSTFVYIFRPSNDVLGFVLVSLLCLCVCLFELAVTCQLFRAYLIKKYDIQCDL